MIKKPLTQVAARPSREEIYHIHSDLCYALSRFSQFYTEHLQEIPGLTDDTKPRRLGPKRASKIRKLFMLSKEDDVRQYVIKRPLPAKVKCFRLI